MFAFGMNGVQIGPNSRKNIEALKKADWLVVGEIYPDETSEFWRAPGTSADEMKTIQTTVYRLPCAGFAEKDGTFVNSARWLQWKNIAVAPPGDAKVDQEILSLIFLKVRELYRKDGGAFPDPILKPLVELRRPVASLVRRIGEGDQRPRARGLHRCQRAGDQGPVSNCPGSRRSRTMGRRFRATGCTADRGPRRAP